MFSNTSNMDNCIFCKVVKGEASSWKVFENEWVYAFLDINPATRYHTLIIPKNHYTNIFEIPESELHAVMSVVQKIAKAYRDQLGFHHLQI